VNGISAERGGAVLQVPLDRPEKLNAVDTPMLDELSAQLDRAADDATARADGDRRREGLRGNCIRVENDLSHHCRRRL
jgi:hypothetical protein